MGPKAPPKQPAKPPVKTKAVPKQSELEKLIAKQKQMEKALAEANAKRSLSVAWGGRNAVKGAVVLYWIPGDYSPAEIVKHIKWLTGKKGIFKYGGIDLKAQTYDAQQPYCASFYREVIRKQWFDSLKSEGVRSLSFQRFVDAPIPVVALVTGAMENALKEYATGVRIQIKFIEEEFAPRYQHHQAALLHLKSKSPTRFAQFQRGLYSKIVSTSNFPHLKAIVAEPDDDELDGVDFDALEASATGKDKAPTDIAPALAPAPGSAEAQA
ncbi:hypothetical protein B0H13DRAFT_2300488 [Mycena leptocephala]|nr:hypothetical protein B0H13DRAFT_2300488 [Mycena leptocephala]